MNDGLTISRFAQLGQQLGGKLSSDDLYDYAHDQADELHRTQFLDFLDDAITDALVRQGIGVKKHSSSAAASFEIVATETTTTSTRTLVDFTTRFSSRKHVWRIAGYEWIVRTRASLIVNAAQEHPVILVWTTEGLPVPHFGPKPNSIDIEQIFINLAHVIENGAMMNLRSATEKFATNRERSRLSKSTDNIRVVLADANGRDFAELLDALLFKHVQPAAITEGLAAESLRHLNTFISSASESKLDPSEVIPLAPDDVPNVRAVICGSGNNADQEKRIVGFARYGRPSQAFRVTDERPFDEEREDYIRTFSPARRLSSYLINKECRRLLDGLAHS